MIIIINTLCLHIQTKFKKLVIKTKFACERLVNNTRCILVNNFQSLFIKTIGTL